MGKFYSTDDLIKMGQLGNYGSYSPVVTRALIRLKQLEEDNKQLKETIESYQTIDGIKENFDQPDITDMEIIYWLIL